MDKCIAECKELAFDYVYDPSQQIVRLTGEDLKKGILGAHALFVNEYESALIEKMTGMDAQAIFGRERGALRGLVAPAGQDKEIFEQAENFKKYQNKVF